MNTIDLRDMGSRLRLCSRERFNLDAMPSYILPPMRTGTMWFSIDKDVLPEDDALTNRNPGRMPLTTALQMFAAVGAHQRVAGADICGEFSPAEHASLLKRRKARIDQPQRLGESERLTRNARVKVELNSAVEPAARAC